MAPTKDPLQQSPGNKTRARKERMDSTTSDTPAKTPGKDKEKNQDRINRKRVQNRISQQCVREKQLAHAKRLEALAEVIKTSTEADATSAATQSNLLNNQLGLIEENRDLRDALLRMRKKMLSLSSAVAAAADDPIFEQILQKPRKKGQEGLKKSNAATSEEENRDRASGKPMDLEQDRSQQFQQDRSQQMQHDQPHHMQNDLSEPLHQELPVSHIYGGQQVRQIDLDGMPLSEFHRLEETQRTSPASSSTQSIQPGDDESTTESIIVGQSYPMTGSTSELNDQSILMFEEFCFAHPDPSSWNVAPLHQHSFLSTSVFVPETVGPNDRNFNLVQANSWKIEEACLWYLSSRFGLQSLGISPGQSKESPSSYDPLRAAVGRLDVSTPIVTDLVKLAVDVMCRTNGFSEYIYGVGANEPMEQVFRWRLSRSPQNRASIMQPFTPTPLQYMSTDYPIAIDFINWPSIRDQLIYKLGTYDFDRVIADIVANTVVELPEVGASVNIHDAFFTRVWQRSNGSQYAIESSESRKEIGFGGGYWESKARGQTTLGWTANDVFSYVNQRLNLLHNSSSSSSILQASGAGRGTEVGNRLITAPKQPLASKWGLDKLFRWKLSREFAEAYPFLDCTGVTASFPLYASKLVPEI